MGATWGEERSRALLASAGFPLVPASRAATVDEALAALGRQPSVISGWFNWLRAQSARFVPDSIVLRLAHQVTSVWTPEEMR